MSIYPLKHYLEPLSALLNNRSHSPELPIETLPELNRLLWGIKPNRLTLIASRTSHGKSSLALQIAYDLSKKVPVLFLSLEMEVLEMMERLFCNVQKIDNTDLLHGKFHLFEKQWQEFEGEFKTSNLIINDCIGKNWKELDSLISNLSTKPKVIFIDHIQEIPVKATMKEEIDNYVLHLREMAIRHQFACVICSQINRASQDTTSKEPQLHMLKGSGALEERVDCALLLFWAYKYDSTKDMNDFKVFIAKNRNGRTGYVKLNYYPQWYRFEDKTQVDQAKETFQDAIKDL